MPPNERRLMDLTIREFKQLVHESVQQAMLEVMLEVNTIADSNNSLEEEADIRAYLQDILDESEKDDDENGDNHPGYALS